MTAALVDIPDSGDISQSVPTIFMAMTETMSFRMYNTVQFVGKQKENTSSCQVNFNHYMYHLKLGILCGWISLKGC